MFSVVLQPVYGPVFEPGHVLKYPLVTGVSVTPSSPHEMPGLFVGPKTCVKFSQ